MPKTTFNHRGLSTIIKKQYLNESTTDMNFVFESSVDQPVQIPAHKCLLAASSGVFEAMFNGSWAEQDEVTIVDASPTPFKKFLQFFYYDKVELSMEDVEEVLHLGQKYLVVACLEACSQLLTENLTNENVCFTYGSSIVYDRKELQKLCELIIGMNASVIFKTSGFLECDQQVISHILKLDSLSCLEKEVFTASMTWVKSRSSQTILDKETVLSYLGDSFYDIRFGSMDADVVTGIFSIYRNLFTAKERMEVINVINSRRTASSTFKKHPRKFEWDKEPLLKCEPEREEIGNPYELCDMESATFSTCAVLSLREIICAEIHSIDEYDEYPYISFRILEQRVDIKGRKAFDNSENGEIDNDMFVDDVDPTDNEGSENSKVLYSDDYVQLDRFSLTRIRVSEPVIFRPGFNYKICFDLEIFDKFCTTFRLLTNKVQIANGITVNFGHDETRNGANRGLICGLAFSKL